MLNLHYMRQHESYIIVNDITFTLHDVAYSFSGVNLVWNLGSWIRVKQIRFFPANFRKNLDFYRQISEKSIFSGNFTKDSIFPNKFPKSFDFVQANSQKFLISQAKIAHLQLLLGKLFYFSSKSPLSNMLPVHDKI